MSKNNRQEREHFIREFINHPDFQPVFASWILGHSDALQWAADWILNSAKSNGNPLVQEFAANMAMTFNAARFSEAESSQPAPLGKPEGAAGIVETSDAP